MEPLVTAEQMRACDTFAIRTLGVPALVLMENAGRAVAMAVERYLGSPVGKVVAVVCGKGNNGGDGFVAARHLAYSGAQVMVLFGGRPTEIRGDAAVQYKILKNIVHHGTNNRIRMLSYSPNGLNQVKRPDAIIDALFGTGFTGAVRKPYDRVIDWMNAQNVPIIAVDVPSGLNSDSGCVENIAVRATETVTMGLKKIGLLIGRGPEYAGKITLEHIGMPNYVLPLAGVKTFLVQRSDVRDRLPKRPFHAHKHSVGKIFVLAGSRGLTGAASMTAQAAMRMGAGAVVLGTPRSVYAILARKLTEVMTEPLADTEEGTVSSEAYPVIKKYVEWSDAIIIGPGLGRHPETQSLVVRLVQEINKPLLLDADGLNAFTGKASILASSENRRIVITPHAGELSRLIDVPSSDIEDNRVDVARASAKRLGVIIVLKGAPTVTATPDGDVIVNATGNPGMATAGSGDVLSGIIGTLLSQKMLPAAAAYCGVYVHGFAGDLAKESLGERALMAMDILQKIPSAVITIEENGE